MLLADPFSEPKKSFIERIRQAPRRSASLKNRHAKQEALLSQVSLHGVEEPLDLLLQNDKVSTLILSLADHSPFLWHLVLSDTRRLLTILNGVPEKLHRKSVVRQRSFAHVLDNSDTFIASIKKAMRQERQNHALLVALCDLGGVWELEDMTQALSEFADASVSGALQAILRKAAQQGVFYPVNLENLEEKCGVVFMALGKHGAHELNYSSDIDLVVFFDPSTPYVSSKTTAASFYVKTAQQVASLLQERTPDGFVHRVDYRLRPDPSSMPVAISLASAFTYYETIGQNWERAAFIKARPIAGDCSLGDTFLQDLKSFIWRRYFDFASIADIHAMKRQIHAVRGFDDITLAGHDIKLGRGGIREIEFFVQTQQLVFGGRCPALQGSQTLDMLIQLKNEGWIDEKARQELTSAYRFLRTTEHRLQMIADEQTQRLPTDSQALEAFVRFCGFASLKSFSRELTKHAQNVCRHYAMLFEEQEEYLANGQRLVFTGSDNDTETLASLKKLGFRQDERAFNTVRGWYLGKRAALLSTRARDVLTQTIPSLLQAFGSSADPDTALAIMDKAFARMPAAVELLTILQAHEKLRILFADLLGSAPRLANIVVQAPHVLDTIIDPAFTTPVVDTKTLESQMRAMIGAPMHIESFLDAIRDITRQLSFLTGARLLSGVLSPDNAGRIYSSLAEAVIRVLLERVCEEFQKEYGVVPFASMAVLALGRLGARQMTASSDLDLIVLYDFSPDYRESNGDKKIDVTVYFTRLTQRLIAALTVPTRRGLLYDVDLRLRPQGGKGPVATQVKGFFSYQYEDADLWEHMALTRARVIAGDAVLSRYVEQKLQHLMAMKRDTKNVVQQAREMRESIADIKGDKNPWDLKLARGSILDLDFLAQTLILSKSHEFPTLLGLRTDEVFKEAARQNLLSDDDAHFLMQTHQTLYTLQQWQRTVVEGEVDLQHMPALILNRLGAIHGLANTKALLAFIRELQKTTWAMVHNNWEGMEEDRKK